MPSHKTIADMVKVPVEPKCVNVQDFAKNPVGKWVINDGTGVYFQWQGDTAYAEDDYEAFKSVIAEGHLIYATDPTAYLAHKAEQEGNK